MSGNQISAVRQRPLVSEQRLFADPKSRLPESPLDMTSMVDVTFLLLIFFMVTASFGMMQMLQQPQLGEKGCRPVFEEQEVPEELEIVIDESGVFFVNGIGDSEQEASSGTELRSVLRQACHNEQYDLIVVRSHPEARHASFVTAWDAAKSTGLTEIYSRMLSPGY